MTFEKGRREPPALAKPSGISGLAVMAVLARTSDLLLCQALGKDRLPLPPRRADEVRGLAGPFAQPSSACKMTEVSVSS